MTIRIRCKSCGSRIDAKDELLGQTRRCPKCRNPILVVPEDANQKEASASVVEGSEQASDSSGEFDPNVAIKVKRLRPDNLYVILGTDREIAYWRGVEGWFVNVGNGFESVKRSPDKLPDVGSFVLAEGYVVQTDSGRRLKAIRFGKLSERGVLKTLVYGDAADILGKVRESAVPTGAQKRFLLQHIRNHYFFEFTDDAPEIIEYLTGFDSHSSEIGKFED